MSEIGRIRSENESAAASEARAGGGALRHHPAQSPPIAELIPFRMHDTGKIRAAINDLKAFQKDPRPREDSRCGR